ncbi:ubiquitin-like modifier-activating enzyme ATG7 [Trichonephila clavata]|uniref:Ubiquitin-like modifier-activating enzyme ATG7 n=2 Tax=Trichonephila clavata TaxID=2740835 RepID=A0A8X6IWF1_TRICU|nr:ubiquitin-like modifier-activating enzyme ATG7 [Trichonephila clavata]
MSEELLQFAPFSSAVDAGFWYQLTKKKLDIFKLDDSPVEICGFYAVNSSLTLPPVANIDYSAFDENINIPPGNLPLKGILINTNTLEDFKSKDKKALLQSVGQKIWEAIVNGTALDNPLTLQSVLCLTFADLKKYHYYYWFAFPALMFPNSTVCKETKKINDFLPSNEIAQFLSSYDLLASSSKALFLVFRDGSGCSVFDLKKYETLKKKDGKILLGFTDPSRFGNHPGWPLRNALTLITYHWGQQQSVWDIVCFREYTKDGKRFCDKSIVISVEIKPGDIPTECPDIVGWEKNKSKLAPRKVDMSQSMNPEKLADAAVDLNLKLMRWRLSPDLQLETIKSTRCLLFGAGTLGCNVARCLMGWGVHKITFIDNGNVSYSNPVRQTLFEFADCLEGGKPKAVAAAEALKRIFPGVESKGQVLNVPMPGHAVPENMLDQVHSDIKLIEELIDSHDVIFLLTDTRESRWLPSLISASKEKIVVNAALGFDTFLVMRHGFRQFSDASGDNQPSSSLDENYDLGCYFCNDVVAPGNSVADRTLDQQCTVTRPGISYVAAGIAVELMVSILQHPKKALAPAAIKEPNSSTNDDYSTQLGIVPHQIRGFLYTFQNSILLSKSYNKCTACSLKVIEEYRKNGSDFVVKAMNSSQYLEDITGLSKLMENITGDEVLVFSDDDDDY